jgi:hypothetical protein
MEMKMHEELLEKLQAAMFLYDNARGYCAVMQDEVIEATNRAAQAELVVEVARRDHEAAGERLRAAAVVAAAGERLRAAADALKAAVEAVSAAYREG